MHFFPALAIPTELVTVTRLARIERFIRRWHKKPWSVATLPEELGAVVNSISARWKILGCCDVRKQRSLIFINRALDDTVYFVPVLAHECAHVLIGLRGYHGCTDDEIDVWRLAARLAVPDVVVGSFWSGAITEQSLARDYSLPLSFIRFAIHGEQLLPAWLDDLKQAAT